MADAPADATPAPTPDDTSDSTPVPDQAAELADAGKQALDRMKSERNAARSELKAMQAELDKLRHASMSDQEKAVAIARQEGAAEAFTRLGGQLVDMAVKAAVAGRNIDADALLDGLDRSRFLTEDGLVDEKALTDWVDRIAPKQDSHGFPDLGQGTRQNGAMALNGDPLLRSVLNKLKS